MVGPQHKRRKYLVVLATASLAFLAVPVGIWVHYWNADREHVRLLQKIRDCREARVSQLCPNGSDWMYVETLDAGEVRDLSLAVRGVQAPAYEWEPLDANMRVIDACYASHRSRRAESV